MAVTLLVTLAATQAQQSSTSAPSVITVTQKDNGRNIDVAAGQMLVVLLPANPTTGYSWSVSGDPAPLKLIKSSYESKKNTSARMGAPQTAILRFTAASAGVANLTLLYRRSWEYNVAPAKTFNLKVDVR